MTREEAITYLNVIWNRYKAEYEIERETLDAYHMAIDALQAEYEDYEHATLVDIKEPLKVSVVRCNSCRHAEHREQMPNQIYCKRDKLSTFCAVHDDDDFCKYGERKE